MKLSLYISEIKDSFLRENFRKIIDFVNREQIILRGEWKYFDITITGNVTNFTYPHNLKFIPVDVLQTSIIFSTSSGVPIIPSTQVLQWNYARFTGTNIDITTSGMSASDTVRVRAFIGRYKEEA